MIFYIELRLLMIFMSVLEFLSHACGGELIDKIKHICENFLSHACGGERDTAGRDAPHQFLSHACGGERCG